MKKVVFIICIAICFITCTNKAQKKENETIGYASYGDKISSEKAISKKEMQEKFKALKDGDTISVKFASTINQVCKKKGCWMKLELQDDKESMVRFKDYGFFVPLDVDNKEVIVEGKAYVTTTSVDQLKHYAKDAGKSEEEIAAITAPKVTYAFEANGVLIQE